MTQEIGRRYVDGEWVTDVQAEGSGGGGSQTIAEVLATGGDPDGNKVTGDLYLDNSADNSSGRMVHVEPTTDPGGELVFIAQNEDIASEDFILVKGRKSGGSFANVFRLLFGGTTRISPIYELDPIECYDINGNISFRVLNSGSPVFVANTAPASGDLSPGECALWFDPTNGAAALNITAKQANGSVKTATIPVVT